MPWSPVAGLLDGDPVSTDRCACTRNGLSWDDRAAVSSAWSQAAWLQTPKKGLSVFSVPPSPKKLSSARLAPPHLACVAMSLEVQAAQCEDGASISKTNLCICAPPYTPTGAAKQPVQQHIDVEQQQPWQQQMCPPCDRPAGAPVRPANLRNTKCLYFNQPGGCKWGDSCLFLHNEEPDENVVFYEAPWTAPDIDYYASWVPDGVYYQPISGPPSVKVEDVRVFFGNVPQSEFEARIRELVEPLGEIVLIDIQPTKLHNRRCSGFIHMTSLAAAEAAVEKINAT
eukprot:3575955-Prymnesium_polylepis.1